MAWTHFLGSRDCHRDPSTVFSVLNFTKKKKKRKLVYSQLTEYKTELPLKEKSWSKEITNLIYFYSMKINNKIKLQIFFLGKNVLL